MALARNRFVANVRARVMGVRERLTHYHTYRIARELAQEISDDDVSGLSGELAYRVFLSFIPLLIFLVAMGSYATGLLGWDNPTVQIMDSLEGVLPPDMAGVLRTQVEHVVGSKSPAILSFGFVGALWAASSAIQAIIKAMNRAYDVEEPRPFWKRYLVAIGLTLFMGTFIMAAFAVIVVGGAFTKIVATWIGLGERYDTIISIIRLPIAVLLVLPAMMVLYWAAPAKDLAFRWVLPGAVLFTALWLIGTAAFSLYVANFGNYNNTYGILAGIVLFLVWLYLSSFILLVGAEINAMIDKRVDPDAPRRTPPEGTRGG